MRHTLKAVFNDRSKAQQALDTLLASGCARADTDLTSIPGARYSGGGAPQPQLRERPSAPSVHVPGQPSGHPSTADTSADVADSHVLTLSADSDQETVRAASLVSGFLGHPDEGIGAGTFGGETGVTYVAHRHSAVPGALQFHAREVKHYFGTSNADDATITGTTFREPMLPIGYWPGLSLFDVALQDGHTGMSETGAAARAAYRFGRDMHENVRYRNRSWHEGDADLKVLWEANDPARPGWDASAAAVRLGWDSTNPEIDDDSYHRSHWRTSYPNSAGGRGSNAPSAAPGRAPTRRNPGKPTAWEEFKDALKHGWSRIRIGHDMDEADYRLHHASAYPDITYEDLAPVYRYGHHVRGRIMFQGRSWDQVESELRAEWERGHREGKPATWDEIRAAQHARSDRDRT